MIDLIYRALAALGYPHPLHPPATHITMGMLLGGAIFQFIPLKLGEYAGTAYRCLVLAFVFLPLAAVTGLMDWQHRLYGQMNGWIAAKIIMTVCLLALLPIVIYMKQKSLLSPRTMRAAYILAALLIVGLGYAGGQLAYG